MSRFSDPSIKNNAKTEISLITAGGNTAMGDGLRLSFEQIEDLGIEPGVLERIILVSDGRHNYGSEHPDNVVRRG